MEVSNSDNLELILTRPDQTVLTDQVPGKRPDLTKYHIITITQGHERDHVKVE